MRRSLLTPLPLLVASILGPLAAWGQAPSPSPAPVPAPSSSPSPTRAAAPAIDAGTRRAVLDSLTAQLVRLYVDADTGRMIADRLRTRARTGAYDALTDPQRFAETLTMDLTAVNGDAHLSVSYAPPAPPDRSGRGAGTDSVAAQRSRVRQSEAARRDHWGLARVDVLPGNVGYMKVTSFEGSPAALGATSAALRYLEGTDAMIFDFRGMRGGSGDQSNFLISHFVGSDTLPSLVVRNRSTGQTRTRYTLATVPGMRRPTTPLWILTDRGTASAGEDFAFVLQRLGRARLVGDRTAGAGHNNAIVDLGQGFRASISFTRVSDPKSGAEWERVGVTPDLAVAPRTALTVAHAAALDSLSHLVTEPPARRELAVLRDAVLAAAQPRAVPAATLAGYTGTYEGNRVVTVENGGLMFRRSAERPPRELVALDDSTFVLDNVAISFEHDTNGGVRMVQHLPDGRLFPLRRIGEVPAAVAP